MHKVFSTLLLCSVGFRSALHGKKADKPNVVLFLVDDMGWMDCGIYGSKYYETPHMDKLAKQSMLFTGASEKVSAAGGCHFQLR